MECNEYVQFLKVENMKYIREKKVSKITSISDFTENESKKVGKRITDEISGLSKRKLPKTEKNISEILQFLTNESE